MASEHTMSNHQNTYAKMHTAQRGYSMRARVHKHACSQTQRQSARRGGVDVAGVDAPGAYRAPDAPIEARIPSVCARERV